MQTTTTNDSAYVPEDVFETEMILAGYGSSTEGRLAEAIAEYTDGQRDLLTELRDTLTRILDAPATIPLM